MICNYCADTDGPSHYRTKQGQHEINDVTIPEWSEWPTCLECQEWSQHYHQEAVLDEMVNVGQLLEEPNEEKEKEPEHEPA